MTDDSNPPEAPPTDHQEPWDRAAAKYIGDKVQPDDDPETVRAKLQATIDRKHAEQVQNRAPTQAHDIPRITPDEILDQIPKAAPADHYKPPPTKRPYHGQKVSGRACTPWEHFKAAGFDLRWLTDAERKIHDMVYRVWSDGWNEFDRYADVRTEMPIEPAKLVRKYKFARSTFSRALQKLLEFGLLVQTRERLSGDPYHVWLGWFDDDELREIGERVRAIRKRRPRKGGAGKQRRRSAPKPMKTTAETAASESSSESPSESSSEGGSESSSESSSEYTPPLSPISPNGLLDKLVTESESQRQKHTLKLLDKETEKTLRQRDYSASAERDRLHRFLENQSRKNSPIRTPPDWSQIWGDRIQPRSDQAPDESNPIAHGTPLMQEAIFN